MKFVSLSTKLNRNKMTTKTGARRSFAEEKFNKGINRMSSNNHYEALRYFFWAIMSCSDIDYFYVKRSECFFIIGDYISALFDAQEASKLNPNSDDAKARISECLKSLEVEAENLILKKDFDDCLHIVKKVLILYPDNDTFSFLRARCVGSHDATNDYYRPEANVMDSRVIGSEEDANFILTSEQS